VRLDHVLIAVHDLGSAAQEFEERFGLGSVEGGRHPGWGTANRIVPLGDSYLELIAVVDPEEAEGSTVGRWVAGRTADHIRPLGWAVRPEDLAAVAARLDLRIDSGSRMRPDGTEIRWRSAGIEEAVAEPFLLSFIDWADEATFPGLSAEPQAAVSVVAIRGHGDAGRLRSWLGDHTLPVEIAPGRPELASVTLAAPERRIEISDTQQT